MDNDLKNKLNNIIFDAMKYTSQIDPLLNNIEIDEAKKKMQPFFDIITNAIDKYYRLMTVEDIQKALERGAAGIYGEYIKINANVILSWIAQRWTEIKHTYLTSTDYSENISIDLNKTPMGSAILFKMDYIDTKDWDSIDTKELAKEIKKGITEAMQYVRKLGIEIKNQKLMKI